MGSFVLAEYYSCQAASVEQIVREHWKTYGRNYYSRHDYEEVETERANNLMANLCSLLPTLKGKQFGQYQVEYSDDFSYTDLLMVASVRSRAFALVLPMPLASCFDFQVRVTQGATLRLYVESYEPDPAKHDQDPQQALATLITLSDEIAQIHHFTGMEKPTVIT